MTFYIAASWEKRELARACRDDLVDRGHWVTSRWLDGHEAGDLSVALEDLSDLKQATELVFLTAGGISGGKHVELGYALAHRMPIHIIGSDRRCIFYQLASTRWGDWQSFLEALA